PRSVDRSRSEAMTPFIQNITLACENPIELAEFWGAALGYVEPELAPEVLEEVRKELAAGRLDPTGWAMREHPEGIGPKLLFQRRPKTPTESIPIHLDISADNREAEVERLVALGATVVETKTSTIG